MAKKSKKAEEIKEPRKMGRPVKYDPSFVDEVLSLGPAYKTEIALHLWVHVDTIHDWCKKYPEFSYAVERAKQLDEVRTLNGGLNGTLNASMAKFKMGGIHGIVEKTETKMEHTGLPPTQITIVHPTK